MRTSCAVLWVADIVWGQKLKAISVQFTLHGTGPEQGTGPAHWETVDPGTFPCLRSVWTFLYNTSVPIAPGPIPCTCLGPVPVQYDWSDLYTDMQKRDSSISYFMGDLTKFFNRLLWRYTENTA